MWFSRIQLVPSVSIWDERLRGLDNLYEFHRRIWTFFESDPEADRSFLFRVESNKSGSVIYTLSKLQPKDNEGMWRVESKLYEPKINAGDVLGFEVRVNPVVAKYDESGKHKRHDVIMNAKRSSRASGCEREPEATLVQEKGTQWLAARSEKHGFIVSQENILCGGYRQHVMNVEDRHPIRLSTLDLSGRLVVSDPSSFLKMIYAGLGPAKAFGCGLMMLRRT